MPQLFEALDETKRATRSAFAQAVSAGNDDEAIRIYAGQPDTFRSDADLAQVKVLSTRLQQRNAIAAADQLGKLTLIRIPESREALSSAQVDAWSRDWGTQREILASAKAQIDEGLKFPPLRSEGGFPDPAMQRLKATFDQLHRQYQALAATALVLYDHNHPAGFFKSYPVEIDNKADRQDFRDIKVKNLRLDPRRPGAAAATKHLYDHLTDKAARQELVELAIQAEGLRRGSRPPLTFNQRLLAWTSIKSQYPGSRLDVPVLALSQGEGSTGVVSRMSSQSDNVRQLGSLAQVQASLDELKSNGKQEALVVVAGDVRTVEGITALKPSTRQRVSSKVMQDNPEYPKAEAALSKAQADLAAAEMENQRIKSQVQSSVRGSGNMGAILGASALMLGNRRSAKPAGKFKRRAMRWRGHPERLKRFKPSPMRPCRRQPRASHACLFT